MKRDLSKFGVYTVTVGDMKARLQFECDTENEALRKTMEYHNVDGVVAFVAAPGIKYGDYAQTPGGRK
jgi:hypothetical protein